MLDTNALKNNLELFEKKFSILQEISNALVVTDNISAIAHLMLDLAINYTGAEKGSLMLLNEQDELYILAARGIDIRLIKSYRVKRGEGIAGRVAESRTPVLVEAIEKDTRFQGLKRDGRYKTRSFISCPVISRDTLLGVLNINDKREGTPFTEDEFSLIKIIANQAAISLENASLLHRLRTKAAELEDINARLIETDTAKTEFLTRVSHDLRTPLNSIKGSIYYLLHSEELKREEQKEFHTIISDETGKLIFIVEDLLDFLRFEDEMRIIKKSVLSLAPLLDEVAESRPVKSFFAKRGLHLERDIPDSMSAVVGDRVRIVQFFSTVLEVLGRYCERGDTLRIAAQEDEFITVSITFPRRIPDIVKILSNSFTEKTLFHAEKAEERIRLYLARKVAEIHRWSLRAEDLDSSFRLSLLIPKSARQKREVIIDIAMGMFLEFIAELLDLDVCSLMLVDELTGELVIKSARGLDDEVVKRARVKFGDRIAGWVALEGKPLLIDDIERDPLFSRRNPPHYTTKSLLSLPLKRGDTVIGVVNLNNKRDGTPLSEKDLRIASVVSERISYCIERIYRDEYNGSDYRLFLDSFERLLAAERRYYKKNRRISDLMLRLTERAGGGEEEKRLAMYLSLIYDVGLMLVDRNVLEKEKLVPPEERTLKVHPYTTVELLQGIEFSEEVKRAIVHHHEQYNGDGYPDGLKGEEIPFLARVLAVADAFSAMTEERPYRKRLAREEAFEELRRGAGTLYDPKVVEALGKILHEMTPDHP
ncbi:MAG: GAF domain-containing protein [Alphaproteobacteria bacterium]|uniref:histidine kinase n=1 Tax=Candidatus Nitrobium versatile TaxID=2884831 RepID=A0A953JD38_9BACT|nr:GAF domain-containing protein [Candidatus Nitrobium versatile]